MFPHNCSPGLQANDTPGGTVTEAMTAEPTALYEVYVLVYATRSVDVHVVVTTTPEPASTFESAVGATQYIICLVSVEQAVSPATLQHHLCSPQ